MQHKIINSCSLFSSVFHDSLSSFNHVSQVNCSFANLMCI
uniref:Uncharacterized protein n=1 Tax=Arundo donax TaxID=35708 RepID=A0A0A9F3V3_ARUDO